MNEREIFLTALQKPDAAARAAYLGEACADPQVRRQIEALLTEHDKLGSFLEAPAIKPAASEQAAEGSSSPEQTADGQRPAAAETAGAVIGPYKLIEQIGEGGMGTVWMAQQTEPVKRVVALKLIKAGMDSKQVIARFEAERQALALMDHPNIAKVFDAGAVGQDSAPDRTATGQERSPDLRIGRPYFVMELVKGVPITKYCDEHHLTPRQRLELFIPVCQAIQHAHQKGIIHRDLKPSNVLIALYDGKPVPKVIDFGVAKAAGQPLTEQTLVTGFGAIVGTLEYMSPEQAEINQLDIDTRSDIYSLGVLLYELLTGSPPFHRKELANAGMLEILRVIREQEPSKPSAKLSTAEGLPTLAANRGTEPAKLTKLVRGELDWIVMKALEKDRNRRYETANGFAMDVQRYLADEAVQACPPSVGYRLRKMIRRNKAGLTVVLVVALTLVFATVISTWQAMRARDEHRKATAAAENEREAKVLAEKRLGQVMKANAILDSIFRDMHPEVERPDKPLSALLGERLEEATAQLDELTGDPLMIAQLQYSLGRTQFELGYYDKAVVGLTKSLQARRALLGPDHALTLRAMWSLAGAYRVTGRRHEALAMSEEIWTRVKAALGADHSETIGALLDFAMAHRQTGKEKQGLVFAEQAYALRKATEGPDARRTMIAMYTMAMLYIDTGQATNAIPLIEQVCEYRKKTHGENSPFTLGSRSALAHAHFVTGQIDRSAALFLDVLDRYRFRLGSQHAKTLEIARYLGRIGDSLKQPGQRQLAKKCFRAHFEHREHLVAAAIKNRESRFADMYRFQTVFVELLKSDGRNPEADGVVREGAAFWEKVAAEHPDLAELQHVSAQNHQAAGNAKRAVELARKAVALAPKNPAFLNTLGIAQYRNSDWNGALATLTTSVDSRKGGDAFDWFFLAMANWQLGKKDDARKWHDQAVAWMDKHQPKNAELRRFRAEAAKLLGIDKKKD